MTFVRITLISIALAALPALASHSSIDCSDSYARLRVHGVSADMPKPPRNVTLDGKTIEELGLTETLGEVRTIASEHTDMTSVSHFLQDVTLHDAAGRTQAWHLVCTAAFGF